MNPMNRSRLVVVPAALLLSLGCTSTNSALAPALEAPSESASVAKFGDSSGVEVSPVPEGWEPVYFDTDQAVLRIDDRGSLKRYANSILAHPEWGVITIDGHCDERGSDQHNRALGTRRAAVVERYLVELGVSPARLATRTFGEDSPAVPGHKEDAWRFNRRSELGYAALTSADF